MTYGPQRIYLLSTGGTIEKVYSEQTGSVLNVESKIDRYLTHLRLPETEVIVRNLMNKDSLEMTREDREVVLAAVLDCTKHNAPVIISHGTDTVIDTGLYLAAHIPRPEVPILLTGAMTPLGFEGTDGLQNLTESLLAARLVAPGIFVVMHNQVFPVDRVKKDRELGRFVHVQN